MAHDHHPAAADRQHDELLGQVEKAERDLSVMLDAAREEAAGIVEAAKEEGRRLIEAARIESPALLDQEVKAGMAGVETAADLVLEEAARHSERIRKAAGARVEEAARSILRSILPPGRKEA